MDKYWEFLKVKDAPVQIIDGDRGVNYPGQGDFAENGYCLFLNAGNVTRNGFDFSKCQFISKEKDTLLRKGKLSREDVILTTRGTVGNVAFYDLDVPFDHVRINSGMLILRTDKSRLLPNFLMYFLMSGVFSGQLLANQTGSAQLQLPIRILNDISIPLPPLPEQRRIAEILGAWDDAIALTGRLIDALKRRKQGLMQLVLTGQVRFTGFEEQEWRAGSFIDFLELQRGYDLPTSERRSGTIKIIGSNGVVGYHDTPMAVGPGVVTGRSGTIGTVYYEPDDYWPLNTTLFVKDFKGNIPLYSYYFLQEFNLERFGTGTGVPTLNRNSVHPTEIEFPSPEEQARIAEFFARCDSEIELMGTLLNRFAVQKNGLMQRLLTGQIRVRT